MIVPLRAASLRERLLLAHDHLKGDPRNTLSATQAYLLRDVATTPTAVEVVVALVLDAAQHSLAVPHDTSADAHLSAALGIALAHSAAPARSEALSVLAPAVARDLSRALDLGPATWSATALEWELLVALVSGWPAVEVDLHVPLGSWQVGDAEPVFRALLAVVTLRASGLIA